MTESEIIAWLLSGDVSIQFQVKRDLLDILEAGLQERISTEGWGKRFLSRRQADGHWGKSFYQPKWICTHYTLLDLRNLGLPATNPEVAETISMILDDSLAADGGIRLGPSTSYHSDVCVNAMFLNYSAYFQTDEPRLKPVVDSILHEHMSDGGFNCQSNRGGARHSSLHTTLSVLEGFLSFLNSGYSYRKKDLIQAKKLAESFILQHRLFLSDRTGEIIQKDFLKLSYPGRWKYDILRALDYFQAAGCDWHEGMRPALDVLLKKRRADGRWNVQAAHPGQVHFIMEKAGQPSRWNSLRALRVLKHFSEYQV